MTDICNHVKKELSEVDRIILEGLCKLIIKQFDSGDLSLSDAEHKLHKLGEEFIKKEK
jgi:hypothetical protein